MIKRTQYILLIIITTITASFAETENANNYNINIYDIKIDNSKFNNEIVLKNKYKNEICTRYKIYQKLHFKKDIEKYKKNINNNEFICTDDKIFKYELKDDQLTIKPPANFFPTQKFTNINNTRSKITNQILLTSLGYDLDVIDDSTRENTIYNLELSPFISGKYGIVSGNWIASNGSGKDKITRDYTTYKYDDYENKKTYAIGDTISDSSLQQIGMMGLQIKKNFKLDPNFVYVPTLRFSEQIALPSKIDLYINDKKRSHQEVRTGLTEFDYYLQNNGEGDVKVEIEDELGRKKIITFNLYNYKKLLKKGLSSYQFSLGKIRKIDKQYRNPKYGKFSAHGQYNYGLTDKLTVGVDSIKIGEEYYNTLLLQTTILDFCSLYLKAGHGTNKDATTNYYTIRVNRNTPGYNFLFQYDKKTGNLTDTEYIRMDKEKAIVNFQKPTSFGSISAGYMKRQDYLNRKEEYYTASATFNRNLPYKASVITKISYQKDPYEDIIGSIGVYVPIGKVYTASAKIKGSREDGNRETSAFLTKKATLNSRYQYAVGVKDYYHNLYAMAKGSYLFDEVKVNGDVEVSEAIKRYDAGIEGSMNLIGGELKLSRGRNESLVLVDTDKIKKVDINVNGKYYGKTKNGKLVLSDLIKYRENEISIDARTLKAGQSFKNDSARIFVGDKTGQKIKFETDSLKDYSFYITNTGLKYTEMSGLPFIAINGNNIQKGIIGRDGLAYVSNVKPGPVTFEFDFKGKKCIINTNIPNELTNELKSYSCDMEGQFNNKEKIKAYIENSPKEFKHQEENYKNGFIEELIKENKKNKNYNEKDNEKDIEDFIGELKKSEKKEAKKFILDIIGDDSKENFDNFIKNL